jgi:hypothetical protein
MGWRGTRVRPRHTDTAAMDAALAPSSMPFGVACNSHSPLDARLGIVCSGGLLGFPASGSGWASCPQRQHQRGSEALGILHHSTSRRQGIIARIYNCRCAHRVSYIHLSRCFLHLCVNSHAHAPCTHASCRACHHCIMRGYRHIIGKHMHHERRSLQNQSLRQSLSALGLRRVRWLRPLLHPPLGIVLPAVCLRLFLARRLSLSYRRRPHPHGVFAPQAWTGSWRAPISMSCIDDIQFANRNLCSKMTHGSSPRRAQHKSQQSQGRTVNVRLLAGAYQLIWFNVSSYGLSLVHGLGNM